MSALERQTRSLVKRADKVERDSKRHLAHAQRVLEEVVRCRHCGFRFAAHDEVDGRCPNPDGTL